MLLSCFLSSLEDSAQLLHHAICICIAPLFQSDIITYHCFNTQHNAHAQNLSADFCCSAQQCSTFSLAPGSSHRLPALHMQAEQVAQMANSDPWQAAQHEAALAAGDSPADLPTDVHLYKEMEMLVEPESQASTAGSDEQSHMQQ